MKKILYSFFIALLFSGSSLSAQQLNQFDQFTKNNFIYNPGATGMEHYTDISGNFRRQWAGFDNAPRSFVLGINSRKMENSVTKTTAPPSIFISNNDLYDDLEKTEESVKPTPHAFGGYIISDRNGPFERMSAFANYAYHLQVNETSTLAFGIGAGYSRRELDADKLTTVSQNDATLTSFQTNNTATSYFDLKAGITYYSRNYFIGYSANQLNRKKLYDEITGTTGELNIHHNFSAGYVFDLSDNLELYPTVLVRFVDPAPASYDAALRLRMDKKVWFGAGYRYKDAVSAQFGLTFANKLNLGYSYAYSTSEIKDVNDGSHEISLGLMLNNGVIAPTKMW